MNPKLKDKNLNQLRDLLNDNKYEEAGLFINQVFVQPEVESPLRIERENNIFDSHQRAFALYTVYIIVFTLYLLIFGGRTVIAVGINLDDGTFVAMLKYFASISIFFISGILILGMLIIPYAFGAVLFEKLMPYKSASYKNGQDDEDFYMYHKKKKYLYVGFSFISVLCISILVYISS